MTKYLISFPSGVMDVADDEWDQVSHDSHEVVRAAKAAGVWIFGGGIHEGVAPVRVAGDGTITPGAYPQHEQLAGGFAVFELPSREAAEEWAARMAVACRCPQELREFMYNPES